MATTRRRPPGRTRTRLAVMLQEALGPGYVVLAEDLQSNFPACATVKHDGVSWEGKATKPDGLILWLASWYRMQRCIRHGFTFLEFSPGTLEVVAKV